MTEVVSDTTPAATATTVTETPKSSGKDGGNCGNVPPYLHLLPSNSQVKSLFTLIRDRLTIREDFVFYADRIIRLLVEAALNLLPTQTIEVKTPNGATIQGVEMKDKICGISIVRSGESMEAALRDVCKDIKVGKLLIQRDEDTALPKLLHVLLPRDLASRRILLLDPMLATGGSACTAAQVLVQDYGVDEGNIVFVCLIAAPPGVERLHNTFPRMTIIAGELDDSLNDKSYIIPGVGDFGDRYFGTDD
ncbi:uracil phosphoribosyltransferase [Pelomyxa schiedti]|nr:uracil phosphoribosyltransferase [Pelomyxa schiedti]